ncbi:unnamed protein product [Prorocentrum cordatum]|uniref:Peroxin-14 n=1 Tax=Prorocentrum cordatum TaxID=2364126 RepID=A0ABN9RX64_9DINO|nr:unnamed protein product [Polarella glacialis]
MQLAGASDQFGAAAQMAAAQMAQQFGAAGGCMGQSPMGGQFGMAGAFGAGYSMTPQGMMAQAGTGANYQDPAGMYNAFQAQNAAASQFNAFQGFQANAQQNSMGQTMQQFGQMGQAQQAQTLGSGRYDEDVERQLERWVEAKRTRDFRTADEIRVGLRARGIDPDTVRPSDSGGDAKRLRIS